MIRVYTQFSGSRFYVYDARGGPLVIPENDWRDIPYGMSAPIDETYSEITPEIAVDLADRFQRVVARESNYGVSEAYWRLVTVEDNAVVQTTAGPIHLPGGGSRLVLAGPYRAETVPAEITLDLSKLGPPSAAPPFTEQLELPTEPELPVGTVVQILDSWGNPMDSTEVVE